VVGPVALRNMLVPMSDHKGVISAITKFVAREGGSATAVLQGIGASGVRITLVGGEGGILGDQVVRDLDTAKQIVEQVDGVEIGEWDRELTSVVDVRPGHYRKMAGWVANT
jgi:hypothetical protein